MVDIWKDFWVRETGKGQQVARLHEWYMMMMINIYSPPHCEVCIWGPRTAQILVAFPKLQKVAIGFVMSVCPADCLEKIRLSPDEFSWNLSIFKKNVSKKIRVSLKSDQNNG